jgi:hypothetical protein
MNTDDKNPAHIPLGYRSAEADRKARQDARAGGGGSVAVGCLVSLICLVPLLLVTCSGALNGSPYAQRAVWVLVPCALLLTGVWIGTYYRNWAFFTGVIISLFIALGLFGMAVSLCGNW